MTPQDSAARHLGFNMLEQLQLSPLGAFHTFLSIVAVVAAIFALARHGVISPRSQSGMLYVLFTILTCLSGFGIFRHGGFDKPHALGVITLLVIGLAVFAAKTKTFGTTGPYIEAVCYSLTLFFHSVAALTETITRVPIGAPLITDRESPIITGIVGVFFLVFLGGAYMQVRWLKKQAPVAVAPANA